MLTPRLFAIVCLMLPSVAFAQAPQAPYSGLQDRRIASLSEDDIGEIRRGGGWGLALPAELNGVPGPAHLLENADALQLGAEQVSEIRAIYEEMRADAIAAGERLIETEAALTDAFRDGTPDAAMLSNLIEAAEASRAALRFVHLSRHIETPALLTEAQLRRYAVLRGYAEDPCDTVPEGHDAARWRQHNGCQ
ncbi:hypothetical protein RDV64_04060 [Acuticoccus sp. MNP-M23]|uniref:hypothetical protein n=1 Tax=Acuticoccus sp. MNP-M23 TaxID=3072793 RepID=UPI0028169211|nr:hypothetical protein [Acuticoccus sp. MNP-M23]WMS43585.1 hypothetical protein RDV64_04060 [Acuticoccus sp. MNP-M23]